MTWLLLDLTSFQLCAPTWNCFYPCNLSDAVTITALQALVVHAPWMLTCSRFISFRSFLSKGKFLKVRFGPRWNSLVTLRDVHPQFLKYDLIIASELCFQTDSSISQDEFSLGRRKPILSCLIANLFFFAALCLLAAVDLKAWALFFPLLDAARDDKEKAFILLRRFSHIVTPFFLFTCTICEKLLL